MDCGLTDLPATVPSPSSGAVCVGFRDETFGRIAPGKWKGHCHESSPSDADGGKAGLKCDTILLSSTPQKWSEDEIGNFNLASKDDPARGDNILTTREKLEQRF
ncbi:hypothetical protein QC764_610130 [Podospora pseudoanserina]|uniref:Uncharacterized protein n=1 Tax=Podospora pseudoanserina TaxID=2609844 RepID=A0ABR0HW07_9PEZI|nr:hypothetical protein QC764_610130 [Podospora pseudoanserina]